MCHRKGTDSGEREGVYTLRLHCRHQTDCVIRWTLMSLQFGAVSLYCVDTVEGAVLRCTQTRNVERPVPLLVSSLFFSSSFFFLFLKKRDFF